MPHDLYLGIDVGTTKIAAVIADSEGGYCFN